METSSTNTGGLISNKGKTIMEFRRESSRFFVFQVQIICGKANLLDINQMEWTGASDGMGNRKQEMSLTNKKKCRLMFPKKIHASDGGKKAWEAVILIRLVDDLFNFYSNYCQYFVISHIVWHFENFEWKCCCFEEAW